LWASFAEREPNISSQLGVAERSALSEASAASLWRKCHQIKKRRGAPMVVGVSLMLCSQCGGPAERCERCAIALCQRRLCAELHEASCVGITALPPVPAVPAKLVVKRVSQRPRRERNEQLERHLAEQLVARISQHRQVGRAALLEGDLDTAADELQAARQLEPDLDRLGATARQIVPSDWEQETDLTPLARALSSRRHPRASDAWRRVLEDRPARSIQAEAAEWLARHAFTANEPRAALRALHAGSVLGRTIGADAFHRAYKVAGIDAEGAFNLYLAASRLDPREARATGLRDPLTGQMWSDQDARWWQCPVDGSARGTSDQDHRLEALNRARDLVLSKRDEGWLLLAEGDHVAGPLGVRVLGRTLRTGCAEPADHDAFVRIRLAYEGAADRLPDVAWPWYRLAELLAWAGFTERAREHLLQAEQRSLGGREADRLYRPVLRALVEAGLGTAADASISGARPFPSVPFGMSLAWRFRLR
jgi:hypothetical protein